MSTTQKSGGAGKPSPVLSRIVPVYSWFICGGASLWFTFAWSFSGMDTGSSGMDASAFLRVALPALFLITCLLARPTPGHRWMATAISALPWAAYPWIAIATFVPSGEKQQWLVLAEVLTAGVAICVAIPIFLRIAYLQGGNPPPRSSARNQEDRQIRLRQRW